MPSLDKCLFKTLAHLKIRLLGVLLLSFRSSLYIFSFCLWGSQGSNSEGLLYLSPVDHVLSGPKSQGPDLHQQQFILDILTLYHIICTYFLLCHRLLYQSTDCFLCCAENFYFDKVFLVYFCFCWFLVPYP